MWLCKAQSNSQMIRDAFSDGSQPKTVIALSPVDLLAASTEKPNTALGLQWDLETDTQSNRVEIQAHGQKGSRLIVVHIENLLGIRKW